MEDLVAKPGFLTNLTKAQQQRDLSPSEGKTLTPTYPDIVYLEADWWEALPPQEGSAIMTSEPPTNDKSSLESKVSKCTAYYSISHDFVFAHRHDVLQQVYIRLRYLYFRQKCNEADSSSMLSTT